MAFRLCFDCPIVHGSVMMRRRAFTEAGGYRATEEHAEDFGLWGRLLPLGRVQACPEPLVIRRRHAASVSERFRTEQHIRSLEIATRHAGQFLGLHPSDARHAFSVYHNHHGKSTLAWFRLLARCYPRLRWHSAELHLWLLVHTLKRVMAEA
jgi:hypothetical protein